MKNTTLIIVGVVGFAIIYYMLNRPSNKQGNQKPTKPLKPQGSGIQAQAGQQFNNSNNQQESQADSNSEFCGCGS